MSTDIQRALVEKKAEAEQMFEIISDIREGTNISNAQTKAAMLRSAFVLLLYNMVESTALIVFERIHERVATAPYDLLRSEMRKIWVNYFFSHHGAPDHHLHLEGTLGQTLRFPLLEDYSKKIKLFSGNLDGRKLNELLGKYGIGVITTPGREKLVLVKNRRNSVAHGEDMFKEACRDLSDNDLAGLRDATFSALDEMVANVETFLAERRYLAGAQTKDVVAPA
ncbi:MAE_28990/MAE_18760 family HEPN-like nuclease [Xanthomonas campestris]|uniref:MAE_28990/MAE_18760 family HEPN-like nuclease n=1 Tax=Xanthomonas campestris TaxID=339 RepID=UPI0023650751|nr:MAE_28990/MAE_18760 family HEPN-like nuclease [Xanthomonas campestris]MEA9710307.1 MAE_28990/MAE_18760 family HEPN-like nuclease [Xanthomonas campestris]MEA9784482.1 MAE_28990/MAE_18760 family HEPN-like nuclease [Xanthomonas campestris pv. raphani]MEA9791650.1 MAE_28990/MAE_18760 family HEPN-like nuclease [Xanthomonas campestris pv. raphani]MEA9802779.1 MAE_28990/MAE_18760 family HEPN-like nuclease [Xanthomonas campestris pv. raphani]MEA9819346.1 MAE_28990/MAE_18760 family HEPN-like nucleas